MATITDWLVDGNATSPREWSSQGFGSIAQAVGTAGQDSDWIESSVGAVQTTSFTLQDTPSDFGTMQDLSITIRYGVDAAGDDTGESIAVRIVNGATILAAADFGGGFQVLVANATVTTFTNLGPTPFSHVNGTTNKATWDGAQLEIQRGHAQTKGNDNRLIDISALDLDGNYTASAPSTNAPAGDALAAGSAPQPEAGVASLSAAPTGAGDAPQPEAGISSLAAAPAAAGTALQATVQTAISTNAPAGDSLAAGDAPQPEAGIGAKPTPVWDIVDGGDTATPPTDTIDGGDTTAQITDFYDPEAFTTAAGVAPQAAARVAPLAAVAAAAGSALVGKADIGVNAGSPVAAGTVLQATVTTGTNDTNAPAGLAAAAGSAFPATVTAGAQPAAPTGIGTAFAGKADIDTKPNTPTAVGSSDGQTVETGAFANAPAGVASATGTAFAASTTIRPNAAVGLAAGLAAQPEVELGAQASSPSGAGTAPQPTVAFGTLALAGLAAATGTANGPKIDIDINAGLAAATGLADPVFALVGNPLGPSQLVGASVDDDNSLTARDPVGLVAVDDRHSLEV